MHKVRTPGVLLVAAVSKGNGTRYVSRGQLANIPAMRTSLGVQSIVSKAEVSPK